MYSWGSRFSAARYLRSNPSEFPAIRNLLLESTEVWNLDVQQPDVAGVGSLDLQWLEVQTCNWWKGQTCAVQICGWQKSRPMVSRTQNLWLAEVTTYGHQKSRLVVAGSPKFGHQKSRHGHQRSRLWLVNRSPDLGSQKSRLWSPESRLVVGKKQSPD